MRSRKSSLPPILMQKAKPLPSTCQRLIKPAGIKVTRIGRGIPAGGDIGYADGMTLAGAVQNRKEL